MLFVVVVIEYVREKNKKVEKFKIEYISRDIDFVLFPLVFFMFFFFYNQMLLLCYFLIFIFTGKQFVIGNSRTITYKKLLRRKNTVTKDKILYKF